MTINNKNGRLVIDHNVDLIKSIKRQQIEELKDSYCAVPEEKRAKLEWFKILKLGTRSKPDIFAILCDYYFTIFKDKPEPTDDLNLEILKYALKSGIDNFNKFLSLIPESQINELRLSEILEEAAKNGREIFDTIYNLISKNLRQNIQWLEILKGSIESGNEMFIYVHDKMPGTIIITPKYWIDFLKKAAGNSLNIFYYIYHKLPQDQQLDTNNWLSFFYAAARNEKSDVFDFIITKIPNDLKLKLNWNEILKLSAGHGKEIFLAAYGQYLKIQDHSWLVIDWSKILEYAAMSGNKTFEVVYEIYNKLHDHYPEIPAPNFSNIFVHSNRHGIEVFNALYPFLEENTRLGLAWHNILCSAAVNNVSDFKVVYHEYEAISEFPRVENINFSNVLKTAIEYGQLETFIFIYDKIPKEFLDDIGWSTIANEISEFCRSDLMDDYELYKLLKFFYSKLEEINEIKSLIEEPLIYVPQVKIGQRLFDSINSFLSLSRTNSRFYQILTDDHESDDNELKVTEIEEENIKLDSMPTYIIRLISIKLFQTRDIALA